MMNMELYKILEILKALDYVKVSEKIVFIKKEGIRAWKNSKNN